LKTKHSKGSEISSLKPFETLSGIEIRSVAVNGSISLVSKPLKPYQGLKSRIEHLKQQTP